MKTRHATSAALIAQLALFGIAACGGGGGGGGAPPQPPDDPGNTVNEGTFSVEAFDYGDPNPESYQPLSGELTTIVEQAELAVLDLSGQDTGYIWDPNDLDGDDPTVTPVESPDVLDFAVGQIDGDPEEELVALTSGGFPKVLDHLLGDWSDLPIPGSYHVIATGDVDGDLREEIVLLVGLDSLTSISVFDDAEHSHELLHFSSWQHDLPLLAIDARLADIDDDGRDEICVVIYQNPNDNPQGTILSVRDDHDAQYADLGSMEISIPGHGTVVSPESVGMDGPVWGYNPTIHDRGTTPRITVGDFDPDHAGKEVCVAHTQHFTFTNTDEDTWEGYSFHYAVFATSGGMLESLRSDVRFLGITDDHDGSWRYRCNASVDSLDPGITVADLDGNGYDELVFVHRFPTNELYFRDSELGFYAIVLDGTEDTWGIRDDSLPGFLCMLDPSLSSMFPQDHPYPEAVAVRLAVGDFDADGSQEVYVSTEQDGHTYISRVDARLAEDVWELESSLHESLTGFSEAPLLAKGDFDGDNLTVRYTGHKELSLGDPLPIVLVAAPPTKSGISQNYDDSSTSYGTEQDESRSYGVSAGVTASVSAGMTAADPFGIASASAMVTLAGEFETTKTNTRIESHTQTFTGSYHEDVIIFQGTLYNCYEYEVMVADDPTLVGERLDLNVPVDARLFKWTVGFYNYTIGPEYSIDPSILGHSVGDPKSYMREHQALDIASTYVGWTSGQAVAVGQGQGTNAVGISLQSQQATDTMRGWSVTAECEYSLFGSSWGHSIGVTGSDIYSIAVTEGTHYEGVVGDISDLTEYAEWLYSFGLLAYNRGVLCGQDNEPLPEVEEGRVPFQVLTYWTTPTGTGY